MVVGLARYLRTSVRTFINFEKNLLTPSERL